MFCEAGFYVNYQNKTVFNVYIYSREKDLDIICYCSKDNMNTEEIRNNINKSNRAKIIRDLENCDRRKGRISDFSFFYEKGRLLVELSRIENTEDNRKKALECFNKALEKKSYDQDVLIDRAELYCAMGDHKNCQKDVEMIESIPQDVLDDFNKMFIAQTLKSIKKKLAKMKSEDLDPVTDKKDAESDKDGDNKQTSDILEIREKQDGFRFYEDIKLWSIWEHYKGDAYIITGFGTIESTKELAVCYVNMDPEKLLSYPWIRPVSEWEQLVTHNGKEVKRFTPLK